MRWEPADPVCAECRFRWDISVEEAIELVADAPGDVQALVGDWSGWRRSPEPAVWSAGAYLWHLVDVLRIGTERLWTLRLDPQAGLRCWDADALGSVRQYSELSPQVGLQAFSKATETWIEAVDEVSAAAVTVHPQFGELTRADLVLRNAHEIAHHLGDIRRSLIR